MYTCTPTETHHLGPANDSTQLVHVLADMEGTLVVTNSKPEA
jgi:hypothetical protein